MKTWLLFMVLIAGPVRAASIDSIYPVEELAAWQSRISHFANGVFRSEIMPVLSKPEAEKLAAVTFAVSEKVPGMEPLALWRDGTTVHLSAASMHLAGDLLLSYAWLGRNHFVLTTPDDYMRMLAHWHDQLPPPAPRLALGIPGNARTDPGTDSLATLLAHDAYLFMILHELGHVLHDDPSGNELSPAASQAAETAADAFALDVMGRIGRVPTGTSEFFELANAYAPPTDSAPASGQTHPLTINRLRQIASDIADNARRYARDETPQTLAGFHLLADQMQELVDMESDPVSRNSMVARGMTIIPADLAPRRSGELIACQPAGGIGRSEKFAGTIILNGVPADAEIIIRQQGQQDIGDYGILSVFGHLEGLNQDGTLQFGWASGGMSGSGVLRRTGDKLAGSTGMGQRTAGATWSMRKMADCPGT